ncbi:hypothetical protein K402DRAFT_379006 [Aulographum hederae CBS 113979]|uniref:Uncharacterized protein n=1 Tax=Aulographum hederae CBS 113979 TaxID=1176131 RepID=A0A6G1GY03_9PEZI|nr:hypothetical protein K402DRAFT_379006 [Aulographum hederae CBS 113979]
MQPQKTSSKLFISFIISLLLLLLLLASPAHAYYPQGFITAPTNGTPIAPGASFPFTYNVRSDYCLTSYNYTVWMLTSPVGFPPIVFSDLLTGVATGHYFGRWSQDSVSNPNPPNPPPRELVMPDFSERPGGFGSGTSVADLEVWLAVIEEYNYCQGIVGNHLSLTANYLWYNSTWG